MIRICHLSEVHFRIFIDQSQLSRVGKSETPSHQYRSDLISGIRTSDITDNYFLILGAWQQELTIPRNKQKLLSDTDDEQILNCGEGEWEEWEERSRQISDLRMMLMSDNPTAVVKFRVTPEEENTGGGKLKLLLVKRQFKSLSTQRYHVLIPDLFSLTHSFLLSYKT